MRKGIHVLCEKPLCLSVAEAKGKIDCAAETGIKFTLASKFRYVADSIKAKSLLASGILGKII